MLGLVLSIPSPVTVWNANLLTYIIILSARPELKTQGEGCEELELLRELEWPIRRVWSVALPTFEALGCVITSAVAIIVHHIENIALSPLLRH